MKQSFAKGMVLATVIFMDLLTGMEFDLFVPGFPQLQSYFGLSPFWVEALLSVNFIGYCISLFFVGGLADRYGRKPIILLGLFIFILGSVFCLFAESYFFIFIGRFLQGIGVAAPAILSFLIIADTYSLKEQQFLMAMLNGSLNVAAGIAPVIGSYLTLYFNWQGNFTALLILGLIALVMTMIFIPHYKLSAQKEMHLLRGYFLIFKSKPVMLLIICMLLIFTPYWIFVGVSPLLYIKDLGISLGYFGYYQGVLAFIFALGSILFGLLLKRYDFGQKNMLYIGVLIIIASLLLIGMISALNSVNPLIITLAILLFVIGQIIPSTILYPLSLNIMPQAKGRISAIMQGGRLILAAIGLQIAGYFYHGSFQYTGIIITTFIFFAVMALFAVVKNLELMQQ